MDTNTISKTEFLTVIADYLPEDARVVATSMMAGGFYEIDNELIKNMLPLAEECYDPEDIEEGSDVTHFLTGL